MPEEEQPKIWASLGMTINMGDYNSQKIDIGVAGIPVGASDELIKLHMEKASLTLNKVVAALAEEMFRMRNEIIGV